MVTAQAVIDRVPVGTADAQLGSAHPLCMWALIMYNYDNIYWHLVEYV